MRNVAFAYPGAEAPVVCNVSFTSRAGQTTAIVGSTGSGKTTLISLVPRLFDATAGTVFVDGVDVRDLQPEVLWDRVGLVPQKPYLFSGTVASNLRYGKPDATEEQMWEALEIAQARRLRRRDARRARGVDLPGRHERVGRSAAALGHRSSSSFEARDLLVRRLVLGARPRHRRAATGCARSPPRQLDGARRGAARLHDPHRRPDPRPGRWRASRPRPPQRAAHHLSHLRRDRLVADEPQDAA